MAFLFFPFVAGLIIRVAHPFTPVPTWYFFPAALLLLEAGQSLYGRLLTAMVFFAAGYASTLFLPRPDARAIVVFPLLFLCGELSVIGAGWIYSAVREGKMRKPRESRRLFAAQALLLSIAAAVYKFV